MPVATPQSRRRRSANSGGSATTRVTLSEPCAKPEIAYHQHSGSDSSLNGMYFILDEAGRVLAQTSPNADLCNQDGCSSSGDCWCPDGQLNMVMQAGTYYHIGYMNNPSGDMNGPSSYGDRNTRTIGIATFDDPRYDATAGQTTPHLSSTTANWQAQWRISCSI